MKNLDRCRKRGVILSHCTSFRIGGEAREFYVPENVEDLQDLCLHFHRQGRLPHILGGGCNTLFPDARFLRPLISTERFREIQVEENRIHAGGGTRMDFLIRTAIQTGLGGIEFLAGVPGTAGGAVMMNAGSCGQSIGERVARIVAVRLRDGERVMIPGEKIDWGYRSAGLEGLVVTSVELLLEPDDPERLVLRARDLLRKKARHQPLSTPSAGCVFRNPEEAPAGALIDQVGLKGARQGGAVVSPRHANFILNESKTARALDVTLLLQRIRERVQEMFDVRLETEIVIPGPH